MQISADWEALDALAHARHGDPFAVLGPHTLGGRHVVRAFIPDADAVEVVARDTGFVLGSLHRVHPDGAWSGEVADASPYRLRITSAGHRFETEDPYSFPPLLGDLDIYLLAEGRHRDFGSALGAHVTQVDGVPGVRFAVWAPNARRVSVVGSFNNWDGRRHPMRLRHGPGIWEIFVPRLGSGGPFAVLIETIISHDRDQPAVLGFAPAAALVPFLVELLGELEVDLGLGAVFLFQGRAL